MLVTKKLNEKMLGKDVRFHSSSHSQPWRPFCPKGATLVTFRPFLKHTCGEKEIATDHLNFMTDYLQKMLFFTKVTALKLYHEWNKIQLQKNDLTSAPKSLNVKIGLILPTGQWYAPSAVINYAWYCMVLQGIALYCKVLHGIAWYCMVLHLSLIHI